MKSLKLNSLYDIYPLYELLSGFSKGEAYQSYLNCFSIFKQHSDKTDITVIDLGAGTGQFRDVAIQAANSLGLNILQYSVQDQVKGADIQCDIFDLSKMSLNYDLAIAVHGLMNCALPFHSLDSYIDNIRSTADLIINQSLNYNYWAADLDKEQYLVTTRFLPKDHILLTLLELPDDNYQVVMKEYHKYIKTKDACTIIVRNIISFTNLTSNKKLLEIEVSGKNDVTVYKSLNSYKDYYISNDQTNQLPVKYDKSIKFIDLSDLTFDYHLFEGKTYDCKSTNP